jgi:hypothetical protein
MRGLDADIAEFIIDPRIRAIGSSGLRFSQFKSTRRVSLQGPNEVDLDLIHRNR